MIVAELTGEAKHHARWEPPDDETTAAAVAALQDESQASVPLS